jgi:DNA-3-methyladenine glycosylase
MARRLRLPRTFFRRPSLLVARDLIGQRLVHLERGRRVSGWIIEAEAYIGETDLACHARAGRTRRNAVMWGAPGHAYVYFTYGMHWCLNVVTEPAGRPAAVLLRALAPAEGLAAMRRRRGLSQAKGEVLSGALGERRSASAQSKGLADGPAKLCQALRVDGRLNGIDLCSPQAQLFIERGPAVSPRAIRRGPRVGLDGVPEPWKSKPWRFTLEVDKIPASGEPAGSYRSKEEGG